MELFLPHQSNRIASGLDYYIQRSEDYGTHYLHVRRALKSHESLKITAN